MTVHTCIMILFLIIQSDPEPLLLSVLDKIALGLESNDSIISTADESICLFV